MHCDTAILVVSCDKYADLWKPFFELMWRYWPDLPFKIYLGSNLVSYDDPRVKTLLIGEDPGWSKGLKQMLKQIDAKSVIVMLEDFFLRRPINTRAVQKCVYALYALDAHMVRLVTRPGPDRSVPTCSLLGCIRSSSPYRVSAQGTLWRKSSLLSLIRDEENIWEFELKGTMRSRSSEEGYFCVKRDVLTYDHHVIERGKWFRREASRFGLMNIGCDFSSRPIMSRKEDVLWRLNRMLAYPKALVPWSLRQMMMRSWRRHRKTCRN